MIGVKKIVSALIAAAICLLMLASCGEAKEFSPKVIAAEEYNVDGSTISATFINKKAIDVYSDIRFSDGKARLYSDETYLEYLSEGLLELSDGENEFYFLVSKNGQSAAFTLKITNYITDEITAEIKYEKTYSVGEGFDRGSISVKGKLARGGELEITDYSLSYDFSREGETDVLITCGELSCVVHTDVRGKTEPTLDENMRDSFGVKYSIGDLGAEIIDGASAEGYYMVPESVKFNGEDHAVVKIADGAFENNRKIANLTVCDGVEIGENAFGGCTALTSVNLGKGVKLGMYSFCDCVLLSYLTLPADAENIPDGAFSGCKSLKKTDFPPTLKTIGVHAFLDCSSLEAVDLCDGITKIGARAFKGCSSVKEIICGSSLEKIGSGAFSFCTALSLIIIPEFVESDDGLLDGCPNVTLCSGPTSIAVYYAKRAGINTVSVKNGSMCMLDVPERVYLGDEIPASSLRVVVSDGDYFGTVEHFGLKYDFSVPGKRTVTATYKDMSATADVFVEHCEYLLGYADENGVEYELDSKKGEAYLSYLPPSYVKKEFILPTKLDRGGETFDVKGIYGGAIRSDTLEKLVLHSEINLIDDDAIRDCPNLSVVLCGVRSGSYLKIGKNNFKGSSDTLIILCELKNSSMQLFARSENIKYAKAEADSLYIGYSAGAKTSYSRGEKFDPTNYLIAYIDAYYTVKELSPDEVRFEYDFSTGGNVKCIYGGYEAVYKVSIN